MQLRGWGESGGKGTCGSMSSIHDFLFYFFGSTPHRYKYLSELNFGSSFVCFFDFIYVTYFQQHIISTQLFLI